MGGRTPVTFGEGLLSGLGHPVIGIDHLAFIVAVGLVVGVAGLSLAAPAIFIAASAVGVALHVAGLSLPLAEWVVAGTVLVAGSMIAWGAAMVGTARNLVWLALFAVAGLFHGYAYGESIFGAETTPLVAYLIGLVAVQSAVACAVALIARHTAEMAFKSRLAGAAIAGIGLAVLAGHLVPA